MYTFETFMRDWGPQGEFGAIQSFRLLRSRSNGKEIVIVTVRINDKREAAIWVTRRSKNLGFPPY